ncbi:hypothetical protein BSKO_10674 [Bryopsis sp. KO-2023]|nr:hypothetical protein BSKO_10674 [Bryopsis sp. KO-2023]
MADGMESLKKLSWELRDLDVGGTVQRLKGPPTALNFQREFVSANKPVIFTDCVDDWTAIKDWSPEYLAEKMGCKKIPIEVTPHGRADSVVVAEDSCGGGTECFAEPHQEQMDFRGFLDFLAASRLRSPPEVPYLQHQNNNLKESFPELCSDIHPEGPDWAKSAFGCNPEAVNIWIGDERSVTSFHKDHYENIYVVVRGSKIFTLLPPTEVFRMHIKEYPSAKYIRDMNGELNLAFTDSLKVPWSPVDLPEDPEKLSEAKLKWPLFFSEDLPPCIQCEVKAGEVLFLPSLWYHHVQQRPDVDSQWVVAVNFWYDMKFDARFAYHKFVEDVAGRAGLIEGRRIG